ncbi:MAG: phage holin family protein [Alkaliphilus sp.]
MDWNVIIEFIQPELFVLVVFLWVIGLFLKKAPSFKAEWAIPFILLLVSALITIPYIAIVGEKGFGADIIIVGIIQAVLIAGTAVFGNELIKQSSKKRMRDNG